jgi:AAA domain
MSAREREAELERLKEHLASKRSQWVPGLAPNARYRSGKGWYLASIAGDAGDSLLIYEDKAHATHLDFNGEAWKGDDLQLIRDMRKLDFPEAIEHAAGLIGFDLRHHGKRKEGAKSNGSATAKPKRDDPRSWPVIMPVPPDAPAPPAPKANAGEALEGRFEYRAVNGGLLCVVDRFRLTDGKKRFAPCTLRRCPTTGETKWTYSAPDKPRPLYGLDRLPGATEVLLVEGEQKADAVLDLDLLPLGFAAVSFMGGTGGAEYGDYAPLKGVRIVGWPDNDAGGRKAMRVALTKAAAVGAEVLGIAEIPSSFPAKWDLADEWPEADTDPAERVRELIDAAAPLASDNTEQVATDLGEWDAGLDDGEIEPRAWLLANTFCRRVVSSLIAAGGVGKTALRVAQGLSLAAGRSLTGEHVFQQCHVLIVSLEDDADEMRRRVRAAMLHHSVSRDDVKGWLFLAAPGAKGWKLATTVDGVHTAGMLEARLIEVIKLRTIDVVIIDPFVKAHAVEENANNAIDFVAGILAKIAVEHDCAVDVPHHISKGPADAGNADRGRGASAFKDAARLVYTLAPMLEDEAKGFGISEPERRSLIRMDSAKVNIAPPAAGAKWFRLVGVPLGNATDLYPHGDEVQTVEPWEPPDTWAGISNLALNAALTEIDQGMPDGRRFSDAGAAKALAAWRIVHKHAPDKTEQQCREIIRTWVKNGVLFTQEYQNPTRGEAAIGLRLNAAKRPS